MKMTCKDFDELIHLYYDQQLDEQKKKEVEKHLSECQRCREKFEALKRIEEKARAMKTPEPTEEYWDTFSQRVRERIISKQKQPFAARIKRFFASVFVFPPNRLKVAAVIASVILVFIVSKLYMDYRGTIPERVKQVETEQPAPDQEKPPPQEEKKRVIGRPATETEKIGLREKLMKSTLEIEAARKKMEAGAGADMMAKKADIRDIEKGAPVPEIMEQEVAKPVEEEEAPRAEIKPMDDAKEKKAEPASKVSHVEGLHLDPKPAKPLFFGYSLPDDTRIPDVDLRQKELSADSLKVIIKFWKKFSEENPDDPFVEKAYLQIAASFYHLFNKTKDEAVREEGIKQIEEFMKISKEEETKKSLKQRFEELKGLK